MNRRSFLKILAGTAAASTTAYFLPPIGGWKSDVIAQPEWHVEEVAPGEFRSWIGQKPDFEILTTTYSDPEVYLGQGVGTWNESTDAAMAELNAYYERHPDVRRSMGLNWAAPMPMKRNSRSSGRYVPLGSFHS